MAKKDTNSAAQIKGITEAIKEKITKARGASLDSLLEYRSVGELLLHAKEVLECGKYLPWAKQEFGFSKQWCSCLTKLATSWNDFGQAQVWARDQGHILGRKEYSVNKALSLTRKWERASTPESAQAKKGSNRPKPSEMKAEIEELCRLLAETEAENKMLRATVAENNNKAPGTHSIRRARLDKKTKETARKVGELWRRGFTEGERAAAEGRLRHLAAKYGYGLQQYVQKCGVESPFNWTFECAA